MPIQVEWDNLEKTVIRFTFDKSWTLQDAFRTLDKVYYPMIGTVNHPVCILLMLTDTNIPHNLFSLFKHADHHISSSDGIVVGVNPPRVFRSMLQIVKAIYPRLSEKFHFVNSEANAQQLIHEYLDSLA